jgi:hypothetical protein
MVHRITDRTAVLKGRSSGRAQRKKERVTLNKTGLMPAEQ